MPNLIIDEIYEFHIGSINYWNRFDGYFRSILYVPVKEKKERKMENSCLRNCVHRTFNPHSTITKNVRGNVLVFTYHEWAAQNTVITQ